MREDERLLFIVLDDFSLHLTVMWQRENNKSHGCTTAEQDGKKLAHFWPAKYDIFLDSYMNFSMKKSPQKYWWSNVLGNTFTWKFQQLQNGKSCSQSKAVVNINKQVLSRENLLTEITSLISCQLETNFAPSISTYGCISNYGSIW